MAQKIKTFHVLAEDKEDEKRVNDYLEILHKNGMGPIIMAVPTIDNPKADVCIVIQHASFKEEEGV